MNVTADTIQSWLKEQLAARTQIAPDTIDIGAPFAAHGVTSREMVALLGDLEQWLGRELEPTVLWYYPNIAALSRHLAGEDAATHDDPLPAAPVPTRAHDDQPIAVIGMGCRFPGASNPATFWHMLVEGVDAVRDVPQGRWDNSLSGALAAGRGGFIDAIDQFDPHFFGLSPREAAQMDPQQRLLLEVTWETLEDAGLNPETLADSLTGVFIGICTNDYGRLLLTHPEQIDAYAGTGGAASIAANRLSYTLGLRGPSLAIDTACSSSLVAVHLACHSLRRGESRLAIAGGVNLLLSPELSIAFAQARMLSPDGACKTFDAAANGYVRGEGCGVVLLKRLADAVADGDTILALIRGSAVNQDGRSNGLTAPNGLAQQEVIQAALRDAQLAPAAVSYVEAHGTGTPLGDPIEFQALGHVLGEGRAPGDICAVGSVKTNIGHLEAAAGIAGLIKVILSLQHAYIPRQLHFARLNPHISLAATPLRIADQNRAWTHQQGARITGVSSFGFGGTNAHVIVEQAPAQALPAPEVDRPLHLLRLAAPTPTALRTLASLFAAHLAAPQSSFQDSVFSANTGRANFAHRLVSIAADAAHMAVDLQAMSSDPAPARYRQVRRGERPTIAFLFTGQGSQYPGMARTLYETQPSFRRTLETCAEILQSELPRPLLSVLFAPEQPPDLNATLYTQPALFAIEYALAELWRSWGIEPAAVMGHSLGELVAACVAGAMRLEDGLTFVAARARLMQSTPAGAMVTVFTDAATCEDLLKPYAGRLAIAAINGPNSTVLSGDPAAIQDVLPELARRGLQSRPLRVAHAFHSPLMDPILAALGEIAGRVRFEPLRRALVSNTSGRACEPGYVFTAAYWREHARLPVQFAPSIQALVDRGVTACIEIGPAPVLLRMGRRCVATGALEWLPSLDPQRDDWRVLLESLGQVYLLGGDVDWHGLDRDYQRRRVHCPTYPFERNRYWIAPPTLATAPANPGSVVQEICDSMTTGIVNQPNDAASEQLAGVIDEIRALTAAGLHCDPAELQIDAPFLELGADSIVLVELIQKIERSYQVTLTMHQLFDELVNLRAIAEYVVQRRPAVAAAPAQAAIHEIATAAPVVQPVPTNGYAYPERIAAANLGESEIERVLTKQMDVLAQIMNRQLDVIAQGRSSAQPAPAAPRPEPKPPELPARAAAVPPPATNGHTTNGHATLPSAPPATNGHTTNGVAGLYTPFKPAQASAGTGMTARQQQLLDTLTERYIKRTQTSRRLTQGSRSVLADNRASVGFRFSIKEMLYPIIGERSSGARLWDVDGNEYIDITMGFGVNLFGHKVPFIQRALAEQLEQGIELGPQSGLAGEVATLIAELTGAERVAFANTGSEAVMVAVRLARNATRRSKIALFSGAYHGHFDGVLARAQDSASGRRSVPLAPGTPASIVEDVLVLDYDSPEALETIKAHAHELAAVLLEPVQSRRPDLQPRAFLEQVRRITAEAGIALIFDEVITGFRIHPGGAQAWFGIRADLATYGKVVGGGLPIGVIAGKAAYMDGLDGGFWQYGDGSYPRAETAFFAGTFCKHPLVMAAARAVLNELKRCGPALQERLNQRTAWLVATLNQYFEQTSTPIRAIAFASLFRFVLNGNLEVLFYLLRDKGVYIWEGRNCFLSTAHTDDDVYAIVRIVQECVEELREHGFFPPATPPPTHTSGHKPVGPLPALATGADAAPAQSLEPPVAALVSMPLTDGQKQVWVVTQLDADTSSAYNERAAIVLRGELDVAALRQAAQALVDRHEALRTVIDPQGARQSVLPALALELAVHDFTRFSAEEQEQQLQQWQTASIQQPFDLIHGPLVRFDLVKRADGDHIFFITLHHIMTDGWSIGVMLRELGQFYQAARAGSALQLEPPLQYRDYVAWLDQQRSVFAANEAYWLEQFAARPPALNLPVDRPRLAATGNRGERYTFRFDALLYEQLHKLGRRMGSTLFMALIGGYAALLHRLTEQDDIVIGTPIADRGLEGSEGLLGYCLNLAPFRSTISPTTTIQTFLQAIRTTALSLYAHTAFSLGALLHKLPQNGAAGQPTLISTVFNLDRGLRALPFGNLEATFMATPIAHVKFDLSVTIIEVNRELCLDIDYNSELFERRTIARMAEQFAILLNAFIAQPEQRLKDVGLLTAAERALVLERWNATATIPIPDGALHRLYEAQAARTPYATALVCGERSLSYAELNSRANQLARALQRQGVRAEVPVGICMERSLDVVIAILGILKAGGAYVPLDPSYPLERLTFIASHARLPLIIAHRGTRATATALPAPCFYLDEQQHALVAEPAGNLPDEIPPEQTCYVIYTSGSTGQPKGVQVPHRGACNLTMAQIDAFGVVATSRVLQFAALGFDAAVSEMFTTLCAGATLYLAPQDDLLPGPDLIDLIRKAQISIITLPPSVLAALPLDALQSVTTLVSAGEACSADLVARWAPGRRFLNAYGPTETSVCAAIAVCTDGSEPPPIGQPIANAQAYILDAALNPVPVGMRGELYVGGMGLARGYLGRPDLTAERFVPNPFSENKEQRTKNHPEGTQPRTENHPEGTRPKAGVDSPAHPLTRSPAHGSRLYRTGDLARYRADGSIEFLGRIDHQVKLRGYRIELEEISARLKSHPGVQDAVVRMREDGPGGKYLVAYLVLTTDHRPPTSDSNDKVTGRQEPVLSGVKDDKVIGSGEAVTPSQESVVGRQSSVVGELRAFLQSRLPAYMVPEAFVPIAAMPLTSNSKVDYQALPAPARRQVYGTSAFQAPSTPLEATLAEIWGQVLGVTNVSVTDDFFALGGDSILSLQVAARAHAAGIRLLPRQVLQQRTIAGLAGVVGQAAVQAGERPTGDVPLTPIQHWFFARQLKQPQHWNQSFLLVARRRLDRALFEQVLRQVAAHHDVFRLRFYADAPAWRQTYADDAADCPVDEIDLAHVPEAEQAAAIESIATAHQQCLDLANGPLARAAIFRLGDGRPDRLLLVIHHLVVDGVSWRILLEDIDTAYTQLAQSQAVRLMPATSSWKSWAEHLGAYARSEEFQRERAFWQAVCATPPQPVPLDLPGGANTAGSTDTVVLEFDRPATEVLLHTAPATVRTHIHEVILAALAQTLAGWMGAPAIVLDLESHGRAELPDPVNVARTVGWCTALYPLALPLPAQAAPGALLTLVKEQMRAIPHHGIGYGLLRYLDPEHPSDPIATYPQADVSFNYLGQFEQQAGQSALLALTREPSGANSAPGEQRAHRLEIDGWVTNGCLRIEWHYSTNLHRRATIEQVARTFSEHLEALIAYCRTPQRIDYTPADFPKARLSRKALDTFIGSLSKKRNTHES